MPITVKPLPLDILLLVCRVILYAVLGGLRPGAVAGGRHLALRGLRQPRPRPHAWQA
jgi:hypothetical protein